MSNITIKRNWFFVDHGLDNYEESIDLTKIIFWRAAWEITREYTNIHLFILFENGIKEKITLSELGYKEFLKQMGFLEEAKKWKNQLRKKKN